MSDDTFGRLMAASDPPLVVVTTTGGKEKAGCRVGFHAQSSITPQHYCVWLSKANHTYRFEGLDLLPAATRLQCSGPRRRS